MSWNDLSMKDRASYIKLGVENGITDLDTIRGVYNKFAIGGPIKKSHNDRYRDMPVMGGAAGQLGFTTIGLPRTKQTRKEDASFISAVGNAIGTILPIIGKPIAVASSLPDILYDSEDFFRNPSLVGAGHLLLDGINRATKWTTTKADDVLSVGGMVDDGLQSQGIDIFDWADGTFVPLKTNNKSKNEPKK